MYVAVVEGDELSLQSKGDSLALPRVGGTPIYRACENKGIAPLRSSSAAFFRRDEQHGGETRTQSMLERTVTRPCGTIGISRNFRDAFDMLEVASSWSAECA